MQDHFKSPINTWTSKHLCSGQGERGERGGGGGGGGGGGVVVGGGVGGLFLWGGGGGGVGVGCGWWGRGERERQKLNQLNQSRLACNIDISQYLTN